MHLDGSRHLGPTASGLLVLATVTIAVLGSPPRARAEEAANPLKPMLDLLSPKAVKDDETIDYRPRAPLVVPPSNELPEPKEAVRDPSWPKDPDADKRRRAAIDSRRPAPKATTSGDREPVAEPAKVAAPAKPNEHEGECLLNATGPQSCLNIFQSVFGGGVADTPKPGVEPTRNLLTEPPAGYRTATVVPEKEGDKSKTEAQSGPFDSFLETFGMKKRADN